MPAGRQVRHLDATRSLRSAADGENPGALAAALGISGRLNADTVIGASRQIGRNRP